MFPENWDIDDGLFWEKMKYLEENKIIYNKPKKNEDSFYILKKDGKTISSTIDKTPLLNSPKNSVLLHAPPSPPKTSNTISAQWAMVLITNQRTNNLTNSSKGKTLNIKF